MYCMYNMYDEDTRITVRLSLEDYNFLSNNFPSKSRLIRFFISAIKTNDREVIDKIEALTHTRIDRLAPYTERDINAKVWDTSKQGNRESQTH